MACGQTSPRSRSNKYEILLFLTAAPTKNLRLGIGTPTILDALAQVHAGGKAARPVLQRGYPARMYQRSVLLVMQVSPLVNL
jgi:hypothetical protein